MLRNSMRKEKISQIDEIDKEINKSYVNSLLKVKGDDINPILFGEMPLEKYKEMRVNKSYRWWDWNIKTF